MKQVQFHSFGQPSLVAQCVEVPDLGSPSAWEVVVDVEAFPINVADLAMLSGNYGTLPQLPATIGMEAVGKVVECGSAVKTLTIGDRVVLLGNNNWAECRKLPLAAVHKVDSTGDAVQWAMLKVNPATAYMLLSNFVELEQGDWVLQTAPLSSVGQCILQIAKAKGLRTINVVHREDLKAEVMARGGDVALEDSANLRDQVKAVVGHDPLLLALDAVGGAGVQRLAESLSEGGQIINYGMLSNESCALSPDQIIFRNISLKGFWLSKILNRMSQRERTILFDILSQWMSQGLLNIDVDSYFSLSDINQALRRAEERGRQGKVMVLTRSLQLN